MPPLLPYREGMPVPDGYTVVERPATTLITSGLIGLGVSYGTAVIIGASQGFENGTGLLVIPIFGPYAAVGTREYECEVSTVAAAKRCTASEVQIVTLIAVDGLIQTASAIIAIAGFAGTTTELLRSDLLNVTVTPPVGEKTSWDFGLKGTF